MRYRPNSIRLRGHDYLNPGIYFITICAKDRQQLFGRINDNKMMLNLYGRIVYTKWIDIARHFKNAHVDVFQIMPDHLHGIIILTDTIDNDTVGVKHSRQEATLNALNPGGNASPLRDQQPYKSLHPNGTKPGSISAIMQNFSSITTRIINNIRRTPGKKLWQRGFYDHIIRSQNELSAIRHYIINNPVNWNKK